jgi:hypothetical protein
VGGRAAVVAMAMPAFALVWLEGRGNETKVVYTAGFWARLVFGCVWVHTHTQLQESEVCV